MHHLKRKLRLQNKSILTQNIRVYYVTYFEAIIKLEFIKITSKLFESVYWCWPNHHLKQNGSLWKPSIQSKWTQNTWVLKAPDEQVAWLCLCVVCLLSWDVFRRHNNFVELILMSFDRTVLWKSLGPIRKAWTTFCEQCPMFLLLLVVSDFPRFRSHWFLS